MQKRAKSWALTLVKIAIAVIGLWIVIWAPWKDEPSLVWRDRVMLQAGAEIRGVTFHEPVSLWVVDRPVVPVTTPDTYAVALVTFSSKPIAVEIDGHEERLALTDPRIRGVFAPDGQAPSEAEASFSLLRWAHSFGQPKPQIAIPGKLLVHMPNGTGVVRQVGLRTLAREANPWLLVGSWALLVIPFLVSAWRWRMLLRPQGIELPFKKCLALTFVGQFYSSFLPGITGGDLVKIIYTARVTGSKTKSTITILLDRVIGLIALMIIGGGAAALQAGGNTTMRNIALLILGILFGMSCGAVVYFSHRLRRLTGLGWLLNHQAVPEFVRKADDVLHVYRGHVAILFEALAISLITQIVVPLSAWLSGLAFGIQLHPGYYFAYVPLAILAASVPLSPPQGFGPLDWVVSHFFAEKSLVDPNRAFALAQAIRFLPLLWNLVGAYWVITGSYSRHQALEESAQLEEAEKRGAGV